MVAAILKPIKTREIVIPRLVLVHFIFSSSIEIDRDTPKIIAGMHIRTEVSKKVSFKPIKVPLKCSIYSAHLFFELVYQSKGGTFHSARSKLKNTMLTT